MSRFTALLLSFTLLCAPGHSVTTLMREEQRSSAGRLFRSRPTLLHRDAALCSSPRGAATRTLSGRILVDPSFAMSISIRVRGSWDVLRQTPRASPTERLPRVPVLSNGRLQVRSCLRPPWPARNTSNRFAARRRVKSRATRILAKPHRLGDHHHTLHRNREAVHDPVPRHERDITPKMSRPSNLPAFLVSTTPDRLRGTQLLLEGAFRMTIGDCLVTNASLGEHYQLAINEFVDELAPTSRSRAARRWIATPIHQGQCLSRCWRRRQLLVPRSEPRHRGSST